MPKRKGQPKNRKRTPNTDLNYSEEEQQKPKDIEKTNIKPGIISLQIQRQRVIEYLGGNQMPKNFNHRDEEIKDIIKYIENCLSNKNNNKYKILMVTGSPGAGKTLSVTHVLTKLENSKTDYKVIKFNANIIKTIRDVQELICHEILDIKFGKQMSTLQIIRLLEEQKQKKKYVLYIEEVEIILQQKTNIFTEDFFCLFSNTKLNIMMLGISNTIDALAKYSKSISVNLNDIKNTVFEPYSLESIVNIIKQKLEVIRNNFGFNIIANDKVLNFIAAKIENLKKGDVRIVLEFLNQLAKTILPTKLDEMGQADHQGYLVTVSVANSVFTKMKSPKNDIILALPHTQQMVLIGIYLFIKQNDCLYMVKKEVEKKTKWIAESLGLQFYSKLVDDGLEPLEQYSLVSRTRKSNEQRIVLKVSLTEIQVSMEEHPLFKKFFISG